MNKRPTASVSMAMLCPSDPDVMLKGTMPASLFDMQYACEGVSKCTYLNPKP